MMYYRFPVSLALGIIALSLMATDGLTVESKSRHLNFAEGNIVPLVVAQSEADTELQPVPGNYESYVQAGKEAETNGNYQQAIEYYRKALELRPQNSQLKTSLQNAIGYAFDSYMQAGYAADRNRNYSEALNNFRQALKLKPDSFYAQQAIRNVTNYLAFNQEKSTSAETNSDRSSSDRGRKTDKWIELNKIWFLLGMGIASIVAALILINLFRSEQQQVKEPSKVIRRGMAERGSQALEQTSQNEPLPASTSSELPSPETLSPQPTLHKAIAARHKSTVESKKINPKRTPPVTPEVIADNLDSAITQPAEPLPPPPPPGSFASDTNHQLLKTNTNSTKPEPVNQVTIVTSKTTKIDLVFELIKDLQEGDRAIRRKAIWELAQKSDSRGIPPLIELMPKVDSLERNLILEAITQITSRTLQPMNRVLLESLEDENPQVRKNAIRDLTRLYQLMSNVTKRLSQMTEDADLEVQQTARWALQELDRVPTAKQAIKQEQKYNQDRLST